jgi:biotin carboxylase
VRRLLLGVLSFFAVSASAQVRVAKPAAPARVTVASPVQRAGVAAVRPALKPNAALAPIPTVKPQGLAAPTPDQKQKGGFTRAQLATTLATGKDADKKAALDFVFQKRQAPAPELVPEGLPAPAPVEKRVYLSHSDKAKSREINRKGYEKLSNNLKRMGLAPFVVKKVAGPADPNRPTVAILSPGSVYKLSIAQEGGRQSPGDVHIAIDPDWIIQERFPDGYRLSLRKGLTFDENGQAVINEYETPRPIRYFANFYTQGANDRNDGAPLEENLAVPQSNSTVLETITNDKLVTREVMKKAGVDVPETMAFLMPAHPGIGDPAYQGFSAPMPQSRAEVRKMVEAFLAKDSGAEVVVKASGPQFHSGVSVQMMPRGNVNAIVDHIMALRTHERMTQDGAVLLEHRITPPALYFKVGEGDGKTFGFLSDANGEGRTPYRIMAREELASAAPKDRKDWNLRVGVARTPWGGAKTTGIFARAGAWGAPTTAEPESVGRPKEDAAIVASIDDVVKTLQVQHGLLTKPGEAEAFVRQVEAMGEKAMLALIANEKTRARKAGEPRQAQTDTIGLDVMMEVRDGKIVLMPNEVNDHDWGGQWQLDLFKPEQAGTHSREWVQTMLARARRDALKGKRIVLVGAGYQGKKFFFDRAKELGVELVLLDKGLSKWDKLKDRMAVKLGAKSKDNWARGLVSRFVPIDTVKADEALAEAVRQLQKSVRRGEIDGITSFWEDDQVFTAKLAEKLGLPFHPVAGVEIARNKHATRKFMREQGLPSPESTLLVGAGDLEAALQKGFPFPAVLKPARGAEAMATKKVEAVADVRDVYKAVTHEIAASGDTIFKEGVEVVLDEYLDGPEWDADIVMQDGKVVYWSVTDNWPTREPDFVATGSSLPSRKLSKKEQEEAVELNVAFLRAAGFKNGVFHGEGRTTQRGPRMVEMNVRPGGVYVRDWNLAVNGVDLAEMLFMTAAGIPLSPVKSHEPLTHMEGKFLFAEQDGVIESMTLSSPVEGVELMNVKKPGTKVKKGDRILMVMARGASNDAALETLKAAEPKVVVTIR